MKKPETKATTNERQPRERLANVTFTVDRAKCTESGAVIFDVTINGVSIYGCFVGSKDGKDFISWPSRKANNGNYYLIAYAPLNEADQSAILAEVERIINS